jgi:hypothetical protein
MKKDIISKSMANINSMKCIIVLMLRDLLNNKKGQYRDHLQRRIKRYLTKRCTSRDNSQNICLTITQQQFHQIRNNKKTTNFRDNATNQTAS